MLSKRKVRCIVDTAFIEGRKVVTLLFEKRELKLHFGILKIFQFQLNRSLDFDFPIIRGRNEVFYLKRLKCLRPLKREVARTLLLCFLKAILAPSLLRNLKRKRVSI